MAKEKKTIASAATGVATDEQCATIMQALSDPLRLRVIRALADGPFTVSDLGLMLDVQIANLSHHLRVLFHAELVSTAREGKYIYYRLNPVFLKSANQTSNFDFGCCKFEIRG